VKTEFAFTLPRGYLDAGGVVHREGIMRLATARDELEPSQDPRAQANPAYLSVALLTRVVTRLGEISPVSPDVIQGLFASDFSYLQQLYLRLNEADSQVETKCPSCGCRFALDLGADGNGG
jgi:hypothetical protein